jgi:small multidrug resistance pump
MPAHYIHLVIAILAEVIGTSALEASRQFTRLGPTLLVFVGYGAAFYFMALALRAMPVGIVYATWSGLGIVAVAAIGYFYYGQRLDVPALVGLSMIIGGVLVIHLLSDSATR